MCTRARSRRSALTSSHESIVVEVRRGGILESLHRVIGVLVDQDGHELERFGDADMVTFWRSSAKPFQAWRWVDDGTVDRFGWSDEELAVMCSSHVASEVHVSLVRRMLADIGLSEEHLRCDEASGAAHECSGNHAGLLAACVVHGWDIASYQQPDHPCQRESLAAIVAATGLPECAISAAGDGCGILTFATPVRAAAMAYARLPRLAPRVAAAMRRCPHLVEGEGWLDTVVMRAFPGVVSKCGAEGLGCAALPNGRGVVVKVLDGNDRATDPALIALIVRAMGLEPAQEGARILARPPIFDACGHPVGELVVRLPNSA